MKKASETVRHCNNGKHGHWFEENCQKTYMMVTNKKAEIAECHVTANVKQIEQVDLLRLRHFDNIGWEIRYGY